MSHSSSVVRQAPGLVSLAASQDLPTGPARDRLMSPGASYWAVMSSSLSDLTVEEA